jgi:serine/threonine protein phosphatase 1
MKKWVIPDLHGCAKTLRAVVEDHIKPDKSDLIYLLGDYIDRGPDPKGVLDYIMHLETEGYSMKPIRGNHEEYMILAYRSSKKQRRKFLFWKEPNKLVDEWLSHGGKYTMRSFGVKSVLDIPQKYIDWLERLPYYYEEENHVIVHAGLNFSRHNPFEDTHTMLWAKAFNPEPEKINNKVVVHGHVPVSFQFLKTTLANPAHKFIALDNGVYLPHKEGMGHLVALELNTMELVVQKTLD